MKDLYLYIIIGILVLVLIIFITIKIIKFVKMTPEEKRNFIKPYVSGIVVLAEQTVLGSKRGQEKLQMVEDYFNKKAPIAYKFILFLIGKDNFKQIIEEALEDIKNSFGG